MKKMKPIEDHACFGASVRKIVLRLLTVSAALFSASNLEAQTTKAPQPTICNRACWVARNGTCTTTMSSLSRAIIHHTASSGDWSVTSITGSKARMRSHQNYHMDSNGWCDLGYHFTVDKLGNIFEGRKNSMTSLIKGTHAGCGNVNTFGFTFLGYCHSPYNHNPPVAMRNAIYDVIAWRMPSGWNPYGSRTSYSGSLNGTAAPIDTHRWVGASSGSGCAYTSCPGDYVVQYITDDFFGGPMRTGVANRRGASSLSAPGMFYDTGGSMNTYRWRSTGSGFTFYSQQSQSGFNLANVGQHIVSADVDGDGVKDIVAAHQNSNGTTSLHVFLNGATTSTVWYTGGQFDMSKVDGRMVGGDFTGDGKEDIAMLYATSSSGMTIYRFISTGSAFTTQTHVYPNGYFLANVLDNVTTADVNGNGKADIITAYQYPDNTMQLHVFLDGIGTVTASSWFTSGGTFLLSKVGGRFVGGNFDGGAYGDVAMLYEVTSGGSSMNIYRFLSNGSSFSALTEPYPQGYFLSSVGKNVAAADVTGDGKADIVTAYQLSDGTMQLHMFLSGNGTLTAQVWAGSGTFNLSNVAGRFVLGNW